MSIELTMEGAYANAAVENQWKKDRSFTAHGGDVEWTLAPKLRNITALDAGRSWSGTQNIDVTFSEACSGDATGWSVTVNGVAKTLTYVSGSGTQIWVMQIGATLHHGDVIRLTYDQATGTTVSTTGSVEINGVNAVQQPDLLSKRIRTTLRDKNNVLVTSEAGILTVIFEYGGGVLSAAAWGTLANKATVASDADGVVDMLYTGTGVVGDTVYAATLRVAAVESQIWTETVT